MRSEAGENTDGHQGEHKRQIRIRIDVSRKQKPTYLVELLGIFGVDADDADQRDTQRSYKHGEHELLEERGHADEVRHVLREKRLELPALLHRSRKFTGGIALAALLARTALYTPNALEIPLLGEQRRYRDVDQRQRIHAHKAQYDVAGKHLGNQQRRSAHNGQHDTHDAMRGGIAQGRHRRRRG